MRARIAQVVEQRIENPRVGSSSLPPGITQNPTIRPSIKGFGVFMSKIFF
jgi:hypothetical protein